MASMRRLSPSSRCVRRLRAHGTSRKMDSKLSTAGAVAEVQGAVGAVSVGVATSGGGGEKETGGSVVLVAGASGRTGKRVVRELARQDGVKTVMAGGRDTAKVKDVLKSEMGLEAKEVKVAPFDEVKNGSGGGGQDEQKLFSVPLDLEKVSEASMGETLSGVDVIVCCVGAAESFDLLLPWTEAATLVDDVATRKLIRAAAAAGVNHFILVSSLGVGKFGLPASLLNSGGLLDSKRCAELELISSGMAFTIIRPGGMERPTDEYKQTHSLRLYSEDTKFGGQVSRLQIAELCAAAALNTEASANRVVEVVAEEGAVEKDMSHLLSRIVPHSGPVKEGTIEDFTAKYTYEPAPFDLFVDAMGFSGDLPEIINGRLAMLGFMEAMEQELLGKGTVFQQLTQSGMMYDMLVLLIVLGVVYGSVVPQGKGITPKDAGFKAFTAGVETLHSRLAMLGFVGLLYMEQSSNTPLLHMLLPGLAS